MIYRANTSLYTIYLKPPAVFEYHDNSHWVRLGHDIFILQIPARDVHLNTSNTLRHRRCWRWAIRRALHRATMVQLCSSFLFSKKPSAQHMTWQLSSRLSNFRSFDQLESKLNLPSRRQLQTAKRWIWKRERCKFGEVLGLKLDISCSFTWSSICKSNMAQFVGTVIGTKMNKTAKVLVTRMVLYNKLKTVRH